MECILALPYQKEGTGADVEKPNAKNKEDDIRRSCNELGTRNTRTNNGKRTSKKHDKVPEVSLDFQNDCGMKRNNGKENGDETADEKIKCKRKRRLEKHEPLADNEKKVGSELFSYGSEGNVDQNAINKMISKQKRSYEAHMPQGDNEKKVDAESCGYGSEENGDEIVIEKFQSKRKKRLKKREPQGGNEEKIDLEPCCYGFDIGFVEDKLLANEKMKSKKKKNQKAVEDKLWENDDDAETSEFILKKRELECDNMEKIDAESCYFGCEIGFIEDKLLADGKIKSKEKKKIAVEDKLWDNDAETSEFILKKRELKCDNMEKINAESCYFGCAIGFVEDKLLADGKIKSKEKKKTAVEDKRWENDDDAETRKSILKKHELKYDNMEKIDAESCYFGCDIGFVEDKLMADAKIKSKEKKKKAVEDKLWENDDDAETSEFILKKRELQCDNREKIDAESCYFGCEIGFVEDKLLADGKIKSKEKKKKAVEDKLWENDNDAETSKFILKKREPQVENNGKIDAESCYYGFDNGFAEDMLLVSEKIKSKEKKRTFEDELWENGDDAEASKFKLKKMGPEVRKNLVQVGVRYVSPYFHNDGAKKIDGKQLDKERKSEPIALPTFGDLMGDKLEEDGSGVPISRQGLEGYDDSVVLTTTSRNFFEDELKENGNQCKSIGIKSKKRKSNSHETAEERAKVRKVSPEFQIDNVKDTVEVEALEHDNDFDSVALMGTCGYMGQDRQEEKNGSKIAIENIKSEGKRTYKKLEPVKHVCADSCCEIGFGSIASPGIGSCFLEDKLLEDGNKMDNGTIKFKKMMKKNKAFTNKLLHNGNDADAETCTVQPKKVKYVVQKNIAHVGVRYVSPFFHNDIVKKFNVQPLNKESKPESLVLPTFGNFMGDKLLEDNGGKNVKPQVLDNDTDSVVLTAASGDFSENELQKFRYKIENIKVKSKKRKSNGRKAAEEHAKVRKVSPYFQNDTEKMVNVKAHDHESDQDFVALMGTCTLGDKIPIEKFKYEGKRTSEKDDTSKRAQIWKVSSFFQSENAKQVGAESCCHGSEIGFHALPATGGRLLEHKLLEDGNKMDNGTIKFKKMIKKNQAFTNKLQDNGTDADAETSTGKPKNVKYVVQKNIAQAGVRYVSPFFHDGIGKKFNVQPLNKESKSESMVLPTCGNFMEDKLLEDNGGKNVKPLVLENDADSGDFSENELQKSRYKIETIKVKSKRKSNGRKAAEEHAKVRKVSPYFQNDTEKTVNVKAHDHESDRVSVALMGTFTFGDKIPIVKFKYDKITPKKDDTSKHAQIRKVSSSFQCENVKQVGAENFLENTFKGNKSTCYEKSIAIKRKFQKWDEAYKRKTPGNTWKPPRSKIGLIQEDHLHDPWRVLAICMLLNLTTGQQVKKVLPDFFKLCPDAKSCTQVAREEIEKTIESLGLHKRAAMLQRLSEEYLDESWSHVTQLHGVGKYAADAYAIFVTGMWDRIVPDDHMLDCYWGFLHSIKHEL